MYATADTSHETQLGSPVICQLQKGAVLALIHILVQTKISPTVVSFVNQIKFREKSQRNTTAGIIELQALGQAFGQVNTPKHLHMYFTQT